VPQDNEHSFGVVDARLPLFTHSVLAPELYRTLPAQYAPLGGLIGRMVDAQAHNFVAPFQATLAIETPVHHCPAVDELGPGCEDRLSHGVGILHSSFELELFAHDRHENRACSTAGVSPRFWNTCVAPAVRSAAVS